MKSRVISDEGEIVMTPHEIRGLSLLCGVPGYTVGDGTDFTYEEHST